MARKKLPEELKKKEVRLFVPPSMLLKLDEMVNSGMASSRSEAVRLLLAKVSQNPTCPYAVLDERGNFVCNYHDSSPGDCSPGNCPARKF